MSFITTNQKVGSSSLSGHARRKPRCYAALRLLTNPAVFPLGLYANWKKIEKNRRRSRRKGPPSGPLLLFQRSKAIFLMFWHTAVRRHCSVTLASPLIRRSEVRAAPSHPRNFARSFLSSACRALFPAPLTSSDKPTPWHLLIRVSGDGFLETLDSLGPSMAEAIVRYREEHGPFTDLGTFSTSPESAKRHWRSSWIR